MHPVLADLNRNFKFTLVSGSPRRRELLRGLGLRFTVKKPDVEEKIRPAHYRQDIVRTALAKINSVPCRAGQILIACDTLVVCGGRVLGKPRSPAEAARFLHLLSGRKHTVLSCAAVKTITQTQYKIVETRVYFRRLADAEITAYVRSGLPEDKAGAYGIQETRGLFVRRIEGCYYNVVGLPVSVLIDMLTALQKKEQKKK